MVRKWDAVVGDDELSADISDSSFFGGIQLAIQFRRGGFDEPIMVHLSYHNTREEAEETMRKTFPNVVWR